MHVLMEEAVEVVRERLTLPERQVLLDTASARELPSPDDDASVPEGMYDENTPRPEVRAAFSIPLQVRKAVVQSLASEWPWVGYVQRSHFTGRNLIFIRHDVDSSGKMRDPFITRDVGNLKVRMKSNRYRHCIRAQIRYAYLYFQDAIRQAVGHLVLVSKWPLRHQVRVFPEFEPAGYVRGMSIRRYFGDLPKRRIGEQTVYRPLAPNVAEVHVEPVPFAIGPEGLFV